MYVCKSVELSCWEFTGCRCSGQVLEHGCLISWSFGSGSQFVFVAATTSLVVFHRHSPCFLMGSLSGPIVFRFRAYDLYRESSYVLYYSITRHRANCASVCLFSCGFRRW